MSGLSNLRGQKRLRLTSYVLRLTLFILFTIHCSLFTVFADEYHYNNILIGDRAAGMGGAYTAIADDPSGLYHNPAGIVYSTGRSLSASANAFHISNTIYKGVIGGNDWERTSSSLLPNFFGIVQPIGKGKIGFSYAVTDSILEDQDQVFTNIPGVNRYVINFNKDDNTYNFGPSYAIELSKSLSVGVTVYAHYRKNEWTLNQLTNYPAASEWINKYYETNEWGIKPIVGLMWTPADKLSVGLTMSQAKIMDSATRYQFIKKDTANIMTRTDIVSNEQRVMPLSTTLGVAYFATNSLLFSGDFSYYGKTSDPNFGDKEATWNVALGTEYYLSDKLALRGGLFTNRANTPEIKTGDVNALDHVDLLGGSLSFTRFTRQTSITLGGAYSYGAGKAEILGDNRIQDVETQTLTIFLSAGYTY